MEKSLSWEADRFSASQDIPRVSWTSKVRYRMYKCPPPVPIMSQLDPVYDPCPNYWRFVIILSSHLRLDLPSGLFPSGFPTKTLYTLLLSPIRATCPANLILLCSVTRTVGEGADNSLARPTSRCRRTELKVSLERGVCSCAELQVFCSHEGWKEARQVTRAISTTSRRELS
jgi:hypothetical protein